MRRPLLLVTVTSAIALHGVGAGASTSPWSSYTLDARSVAVAIRAEVPGGPLSDVPIDGGTAWSTAHLSSLGTSTGAAAVATPGPLALSVLGLATSAATNATGQSPPVIVLPGSASSSYPVTPEASASAGVTSVHASSQPDESAASAEVAGGVSSTTAVRHAAGELSARAVSTVVGFAAGPVTVGRVHAEAAITRSPDGTVLRAVELEADELRVAGAPVVVGPGTTYAANGVVVRYLTPTESEESVVSPALEITVTAPVEFADTGRVTSITYTLGRATASSSAVASAVPPTATPATGHGPNAGGEGAAAGGGSSTAGHPSTGTAAPVHAPGVVVPAPVGEPESMPVVAAPRGEQPRAAGPIRPLGDASVVRWYEVLLVAGAAMVLASIVFVRRGVRGTWTS